MKATTKNKDYQLAEKIALDTNDLMQMLSCGRKTAVEIGMAAQARVSIGRRVLWSSEKIKAYLSQIAR